MKRGIDIQLETLKESLVKMSLLSENAIRKAMEALLNGDKPLARQVMENDGDIDALNREIEALCFKILLLSSPVASDFLQVGGALKMITDLERIGDYAVDIAEESLQFKTKPSKKSLFEIPEMGEAAISIVHKAVRGFINADVESARSLDKDDDKLDSLFAKTRSDLLSFVREKGKGEDRALSLMVVAKYLERIGDHAVNIGEWVDYAETGTHGES